MSGASPAAILYLVDEGGVRTVSWDFDHRGDGTIEPGPIWAYLDGPEKVFQCPEFHGSSTFGDDPATGYNYNTTYIGAEGRYPIPQGDRILQGWDHCRRGVPAGRVVVRLLLNNGITPVAGDAKVARYVSEYASKVAGRSK